MDLVNKISTFELGELEGKETIELFSELIETKQAWSLQGKYGRVADDLIKKGVINKNGKINWDTFNELVNA